MFQKNAHSAEACLFASDVAELEGIFQSTALMFAADALEK